MSEIDRLHDALERQSETIAALRNEASTWQNGFNAANEALRMAAERIAELEAQLAATLATIEAACTDGRTYSEGCAP